MAAIVQVLCPNGRRQNVKVTPNTKLLQVLEEVCTKQGFLTFDDYDLIHGRKSLDLTLAFRFSNLSNNAKLELVKSASPRSQTQGEVTIALQLENGERLQHTFHSSVSLWEILQHWEQQDVKYKEQLTCIDGSQPSPVHPVCIYMREEVVGEAALQYMTLKKLALTSGKAIIRLVHRPVDDGTLAEVVNKIEKEKAKDARLTQKALEVELLEYFPPVSSTVAQQSTPADTEVKVPSDARQATAADENMEVDKPAGQKTAQEKKGKSGKLSDPKPMNTEDTKAKSGMKSVADSSPASCVDRPSAGASASGSNPIDQLRNMNIPGVEIITPQDFHDLSPEQQQMARRLMQEFVPAAIGQQHQDTPRPKKLKATPPPQRFTDFKFPEETKGKDLYHNELSDVKSEEYKPCDRETVIYNINEANTSKAFAEEPTEDFFQVTEADVRSLYKERQKQVTSERMLMTESMRQMELEERHQQYQHLVIRIQFPDGLVLQGCFRPKETVFALHKFVREHLEDKNQEFQLYRTPPKQLLTDMSKSLVQADLAPATLVYFSSDKMEAYSLSGSAREEVSSKRRADELSVKKLAKKQMETLATSGGSAENPSVASSSSSKAEAHAAREATPSSSRPALKTPASAASSEAKMPKWLKLGKK